jgi:hypothetical protein
MKCYMINADSLLALCYNQISLQQHKPFTKKKHDVSVSNQGKTIYA